METTPLVSIIMPLYNAEKYVAEAIESVVKQSYQNWELIIVNDGSTDDSLAIAKKYESEKIKIFAQENKGASAARNFGYLQTAGELIKFFDADDLISENMLDNQVSEIGNDADNMVVSKWGRFYQENLETYVENDFQTIQKYMPIVWLHFQMKNAQPMTQPGMFLFSKKLIEKAGLWNEDLSLIDDFEFFTRLVLNANLICPSPNCTLYYRSGLKNALSGKQSRNAVESAYLSISLGTEAMLKYEDSIQTKLCASNMWQGFVYEFYYAHPDLAKKAIQKIKILGGSNLKYPAGGYSFILSKLIGWKWVALIKFKRN